jgi:hypothetical protein
MLLAALRKKTLWTLISIGSNVRLSLNTAFGIPE